MKETKLRRVLTTLVLLSGLLSCISTAQETSDHRPNRTIIHAGKLLEVKTGKTLSDQAVVIEGDKIVSVGPRYIARRAIASLTCLTPPFCPGSPMHTPT